MLSPSRRQVIYALLTRSPLEIIADSPFDLHVLSTPPAFVLSQDQTLQYIYWRTLMALFCFVLTMFPLPELLFLVSRASSMHRTSGVFTLHCLVFKEHSVLRQLLYINRFFNSCQQLFFHCLSCLLKIWNNQLTYVITKLRMRQQFFLFSLPDATFISYHSV